MNIKSQRNVNTSVVAALLFVVTLAIFKSNVFQHLDKRLSDWQISASAHHFATDRSIVMIDIDDNSINAMKTIVGRWSWPRSVYAEVFEQLNHYKPKAIVVDILFAEPDIYRPDDDAYFSEVVAQFDNIYFASLLLNSKGNTGNPLTEIAEFTSIEKTSVSDVSARRHFVLPTVVGAKQDNVGTINTSPDEDDTIREYPLHNLYRGWKINSLPYVVAKALSIELPSQSKVTLSWSGGGQNPYQRVSFVDVYRAVVSNDQSMLGQFSDRIVIVGASAAGLFDAHHTPVHPELPGMYTLAVAIDNLLNNNFITPADPTAFFAVYFLVFIGIHLVFAFLDSYSKQVMLGGMIFLLATALSLWWSYWLLSDLKLLHVVTPILCWLMVLVTLSVVHGYLEYSQRQFALSVFGRFLDPTMVSTLYQKGELEISQLNKKSRVTVMFSDIRNFTRLSEKHQADEVLALLNQYFTHQVEVIFKHHGTLDKFIGDCVMAFWGAPQADTQQEVHALEAALAMSEFIDEFRKALPPELADFDIGIGIHTGQAIVGMVGADLRVDYTVIGDTVNVASRIEGLTKTKSRILVSRETMEAAKSQFSFEYVGQFEVKGRTSQVELYRPKGRK